jgi:P27 family predicted phage terminase small subunit
VVYLPQDVGRLDAPRARGFRGNGGYGRAPWGAFTITAGTSDAFTAEERVVLWVWYTVGMPGIAKPTALRIAEGNRGKVKINPGEPNLPKVCPDPPAEFSPEAHAEWNRVVPALHGIGMLTDADRASLVAYCTAWGNFVEASRILKAEGLIIEGTQGKAMVHPAFKVQRESTTLMLRLGREFGLTPSARVPLDTGMTPEDEMDAILEADGED